MRNKLADFRELILNKAELFLISERKRKLHNTFPNAQFETKDEDRNKFGGGIILFLTEYIPGRMINRLKLPAGIEIMCF